MKINLYLIQLGIIIIVIFAGTFTIRYFKTGELLIDQIIGTSVGAALLIGSLIWRKLNPRS
ncbi:hypothetical protein BIV60_16035 [Bacillus sp. MUM 116]|uniref:hypothetical protein n=1 Tax=Bacillus sp. MUM 116 TaxID=1678002 RepID=UPI0008F57625|nr:hypothetical protein [Bacillus sp. MUM 116]OIK12661.1 hypothetical protein BIV60_16035 [Bacillus sp. MUM 116]